MANLFWHVPQLFLLFVRERVKDLKAVASISSVFFQKWRCLNPVKNPQKMNFANWH